MLQFNHKIRTRVSYSHPIEFGQILYSKRYLYSMSFFDNNKITEINFQNKTKENWSFSDDDFIESYERFSLGLNTPVFSARFMHFKKLEDGKTEFSCYMGKVSGSAKMELINPNLQIMMYSHVNSHLGYETNHFFGQNFILEKNIIKETQTFKRSYKNGTEIFLALTHEYQFKETDIEKTTENILKFGWNDNDVNRLIKEYSF